MGKVKNNLKKIINIYIYFVRKDSDEETPVKHITPELYEGAIEYCEIR